jgi:hypothetical protein
MKRLTTLYSFVIMCGSQIASGQSDTIPKVPFEGMDLSWINGQNRQQNFPLTLVLKDFHFPNRASGQ